MLTQEKEIVLTGTCHDKKELKAVLATVVPKASTWRIVERIPKHWLDQGELRTSLIFDKIDDTNGSEEFERGWLFSDNFECRWQPTDEGKIHVRYIGIPPSNSGSLNKVELDGNLGQETINIQLWGRRIAPAGPFINARSPVLRNYPTTKSTTKTMHVVVKESRDPTTGTTLLWRFCRMEERE